MTKPTLLDPKWTYRDAEETKKPGYLARRFAAIRRQQREAAARQAEAIGEASTNVTPIKATTGRAK